MSQETTQKSRDQMIAFSRNYRKSLPYLARSEAAMVRAFDRLAPGWKRVKSHFIMIDKAPYNNGNCDVVHELPGGIFVRGWDYTGVINPPSWTLSRL